jgi:hypothetical protein
MRPKWEREDYRQRTIKMAIQGCKDGYTPRPKALPEVREAVRALQAFAEQDAWTGRGGPTDRSAFGFLLNTGGGYGQARRDGIEVWVAQRDMAPDIGRSRSSTAASLKRLEGKNLIKVLDPGSAKRPAKILIRYLPQTVHIEKLPPRPPPVFNMDRLRELLFKVRNPAPEMPGYDRNGRRISPARSELVSPLGGLRALMVEKVALAPSGLSAPQIAEVMKRRIDKIAPLLPALLECGILELESGVYRVPSDLLQRVEAELERSGCNAAEERDRRRYLRDREAQRLYVRESRGQERTPDGTTSELELVEPDACPSKGSPVITNAKDPDQFREFAAFARERLSEHRREGSSRSTSTSSAQQAARLLRRLGREDPNGYEALKNDPLRLGWEPSGRGWTGCVFSVNTVKQAMVLLGEGEAAA